MPSGSVVCIRPGTYYETIEPRNPDVTYRGLSRPGHFDVVVSGLDPLPLTGWEPVGNNVWRWGWTPRPGWATESNGGADWFLAFDPFGPDVDPGPGHALRREMLVANPASVQGAPPVGTAALGRFEGHVMLPVGTRQDLDRAPYSDPWGNGSSGTYGAFWVDAGPSSGLLDARRRPVFGPPVAIYARFPDNQTPSQAHPRISVRPSGLLPRHTTGASANVGDCGQTGTVGRITVEGIAFRHTNAPAQRGGVCPGREGSTLRRVAAEFTNAVGVHTGNHGGAAAAPGQQPTNDGGRDHVFIAVRANNNGQMGMGGECDRCLLSDSEVSRNNWKDINFGWEAGGTKFSFTEDMIVRRVRAFDNNGPGIWFDIANRDNTIEGSWVHGNALAGIFVELYSVRTLVQHNIVSGTQRLRSNLRVGQAAVSNFEGAGIGIQDAPLTYVYHNTSVNNEGSGLHLNTTGRILPNAEDGADRGRRYGFSEPQWGGSRSVVHNNVIAGNVRVDPTVGFNREAREVQVEEKTTLANARTNGFVGNVYLGEYPADLRAVDKDGFALYHGETSGPNASVRGNVNDNPAWKALLGVPTSSPEYDERVIAYADLGASTVPTLSAVGTWSQWPTLLRTGDSPRRNRLLAIEPRPDQPSRRQGYCYSLNGANPGAVLGAAFLDAPPECPASSSQQAYITGNTTLTAASASAYEGREVFVADGVTLTVDGTFALRPNADGVPAVLHLGGARLAGGAGARIRVVGGSHVEVAPASRTDAYLGAVTLSGTRPLAPGQTEAERVRSRIVVQPGAELAVRSFVEAEDGATLDLRGGVHLAPGARITLRPSAWPAAVRPGMLVRMGMRARVQFLAPNQSLHGTDAAPITFERAGAGEFEHGSPSGGDDGSQPFEDVTLGGSGASLRHVHAAGGTNNLVFTAPHADLDHVVSTDAQQAAIMVATGPGPGVDVGLRAGEEKVETHSFRIANSRAERSFFGVVLHHVSNGDLENVEIRDNALGLSLHNAHVARFQRNRVAGGGGYGVHLSGASVLRVGTGAGPSFNRVTGSGSAEVLVESGSTVVLGTIDDAPVLGGSNTVADDSGGTLVWNLDKRTAFFDRSWWGGPLDPGRFFGEVSAREPLAFDPGAGQLWVAGPGTAEHILAGAAAMLATTPVTDEHEMAVRDLLVPALVGEGATRDAARALIEAWARPATDLEVIADPALAAVATAAGLVHARVALSTLDAEAAQVALDAAPASSRPEVVVETWHMVASVAEADGRFGDALAALDAADAIALPRPPEDGNLRTTGAGKSGIRTDPRRLALARTIQAAEAAASDAQLRGTPGAAPVQLRVHAPWPNPSRGQAVRLAVDVPSAGVLRVSVHDALGREVLVLHDGWAAAGRVEASVSARSLASGVYAVRASSGREAHAARITVLR